MVYNKVYAQIGEERHITIDPINYQYDVKQILVLTGETVPDYYEADICNVGDTATLTMIGTAADGVEIPDKFLLDGRNVLVYVVIPGSGGDVQTRYDITIPVDERAEREDIDPSEAEQQQIDSLINALNSGVARAEAAATAAEESATDAEGSAGEAEDQAENAEAWAVGQRAGEDVPDTDPTYHNNSKYYAERAEAAAEEAGQHEASWESWVRRAENAADDAEGSARAAAGAKDDAEAAAQTAAQKATEAGNSAAAASSSAASARQTVDGAIGAINTAKEDALTAIGSAGSNAVGAVEQAGTTQTGRVTNEGNTQVNRVQSKGDEVLDSIPQDYSDLVDNVADLTRQLSDETTGLDTKAPVIVETSSGAIASFSDGADSMPIKKLVAQIEPVQDLHGYDAPWPAGGWKNLFPPLMFNDSDSLTYGGITMTPIANGFHLQGQTTTTGGRTNLVSKAFVLPAGTYTLSVKDGYSDIAPVVESSASPFPVVISGSGTFTLEAESSLLLGFQITATGSTVNKDYFVQIELGSTATAWTPYSNLCPISGWTGANVTGTGKNLYNPAETEQNLWLSESGIKVANGYWLSGYIFLKAGQTYYRPATESSRNAYFNLDKSFKQYLGRGYGAFTPVEDCYFRFVGLESEVPASGNIQFELGSTATAYEPYTGNIISVTFPDEAGDSGTVYGGTITINPDRTGTLVVTDRKDVFDDVSNISLYWSQAGTYGNRFNLGLRTTNKMGSVDFVSNVLVPTNAVYSSANWRPYQGFPWRDNTNDFFLILPLEYTIDRIADAKALIASWGLEICYKLLNPIEIPLTASEVSGILTTLYGQNNVWCDTGAIIECDYPADTKLYIDNKITQAIANALNS